MLPGFEPVYNDLAWAHLVLGNPGETLAALDAYIRVNGANARPSADGLFLRGEAYRALGRTEDAVQVLERYLEISPDGRYTGPAGRSLDTLLAAAGDGG